MRVASLSLMLLLPVLACAAEPARLQASDGAILIDEPLSAFEPDDRPVDARGAVMSVREILRARTAHEFIDGTTLDVQRGGARITLRLESHAHWGLRPMSDESLPAQPRRRVPDPGVAALSAEEKGLVALARWDGAGAEARWREALALREGIDTQDVAALKARHGIAEALLLRRDLAAATTAFAEVDAALARRWPRAPLRYRVLLGRALAALEKRDFVETDRQFAAIDALTAQVPMPALSEVEILRVRGRVRYFREDLAGARQFYEKAWARALALVPDSTTAALIDTNLGVIEWRQGDLVAAERRYSRALEVASRDAPGSVFVGGLLMNLGTVGHLRRDYASAERQYRRAAELFGAVSANSPETLRVLTNLALAQGLGGNPAGAVETLERVLAVQEVRTPGSLDVAYTQHALGLNHWRLDDFAAARTHYSAAAAIREKNGLLGIGLANTLTSRAEVLRQLGEPGLARADLRRAVAVYERLAPYSHAFAEALHTLGLIERDTGDRTAALDHLRRATLVLDAQQSHLGGSDETRSSWSAYYSSFYKDYAELLLRDGREPDAFETLERYRGRVLRAALAGGGRAMDFALPEALRAERDTLRASFDATLAKLPAIEKPAEETATVTRLLGELEDVRARQDVLAARIRERAPRVSELESVQASDVATVRASLARDTALVSYAVLPDGLQVFVVTPERGTAGLVSTHVPIASADLRERVDRFAFLLSTPSDAADARGALDAAAGEFHRLLVAPVAASLRRYPNWIVVPDGPLHRLPFAALIERPAVNGGRQRYVVESHGLTTVVSATVYGQILRRDRARGFRPGIVAFGDPQLEADARVATSSVRGDSLRDDLLRPLPWARTEVNEIGRLLGPAATVHVGAEATEGRVRAAAVLAPALHFASHGVLDEQSPLDSFLLLAGPVAGAGPDDDGRLSAREVFDLPPLVAGLVTLSACSTSAAADNAGEGLMGLTRAFQAAGANEVVSSLWKVSDRSTSELMVEFYRHWPRADAATALARAQRRFVDRHPFYWAAFEVSGARQRR